MRASPLTQKSKAFLFSDLRKSPLSSSPNVLAGEELIFKLWGGIHILLCFSFMSCSLAQTKWSLPTEGQSTSNKLSSWGGNAFSSFLVFEG